MEGLSKEHKELLQIVFGNMSRRDRSEFVMSEDGFSFFVGLKTEAGVQRPFVSKVRDKTRASVMEVGSNTGEMSSKFISNSEYNKICNGSLRITEFFVDRSV